MPPYIVCGQGTRQHRVAWPLFLRPESPVTQRPARRRFIIALWRRTGIALLTAVLCLGFFSNHAAGYVVPGPQAAELMIRALGNGKTLSVRQRVVFYDFAADSLVREVTESAVYIFPERYRSEIRSTGIHRIHVEADGKSITITDGSITNRSVSWLDRYKDLLLCRERSRLIERLAGFGVNPLVTSLGRFGEVVVVIIGARYPDEDRPQVWLDKNSFLPLRWILRPDSDPEGPFEVQFSAWQEVARQWYPRRIEFYENNVIVREILVEKVVTSASVNPEDFDVDDLATRFAQPVAPENAGDVPPASEIEKAIEDFRKRFEQ